MYIIFMVLIAIYVACELKESKRQNTCMDEESVCGRQIRKEQEERAVFLNRRAREKFEKKRYEHHKKTIEAFEEKSITSKL